MRQSEGSVQLPSTLFEGSSPFPNVFHGPFPTWTCEINPTDYGKPFIWLVWLFFPANLSIYIHLYVFFLQIQVPKCLKLVKLVKYEHKGKLFKAFSAINELFCVISLTIISTFLDCKPGNCCINWNPTVRL